MAYFAAVLHDCINLSDENGWKPVSFVAMVSCIDSSCSFQLMYAAQNGNAEAIEVLAAAGAHIFVRYAL